MGPTDPSVSISQGGGTSRPEAAQNPCGQRAQLAPYRGAVIIGSELNARFGILGPPGRRFQLLKLASDLPRATHNFEAASYVPG